MLARISSIILLCALGEIKLIGASLLLPNGSIEIALRLYVSAGLMPVFTRIWFVVGDPCGGISCPLRSVRPTRDPSVEANSSVFQVAVRTKSSVEAEGILNQSVGRAGGFLVGLTGFGIVNKRAGGGVGFPEDFGDVRRYNIG